MAFGNPFQQYMRGMQGGFQMTPNGQPQMPREQMRQAVEPPSPYRGMQGSKLAPGGSPYPGMGLPQMGQIPGQNNDLQGGNPYGQVPPMGPQYGNSQNTPNVGRALLGLDNIPRTNMGMTTQPYTPFPGGAGPQMSQMPQPGRFPGAKMPPQMGQPSPFQVSQIPQMGQYESPQQQALGGQFQPQGFNANRFSGRGFANRLGGRGGRRRMQRSFGNLRGLGG